MFYVQLTFIMGHQSPLLCLGAFKSPPGLGATPSEETFLNMFILTTFRPMLGSPSDFKTLQSSFVFYFDHRRRSSSRGNHKYLKANLNAKYCCNLFSEQFEMFQVGIVFNSIL